VPARMATPVEVGSITAPECTIVWSDGHRSTYRWGALRANCPCAVCVQRGGHPPRPLPDPLPALRPMQVERVGAYALRFVWPDGHRTGIYPFPLLREVLCECEACRARAAGRGGGAGPVLD